MAVKGKTALDGEKHAELLDLMPLVKEGKLTTADVASRLRCSIPTVLKYSRLPLDYVPPKRGRVPSVASLPPAEGEAA